MKEPDIGNFPTEIFGYPYTTVNKTVQKSRAQQYCPFLDAECKKPRKSQPKIKVGSCSVGYAGFKDDHLPVVICPHRFNCIEVFQHIEKKYFSDKQPNETIEWVPEVSLGVGGSIDFVAARISHDKGNEQIIDFLCVEFQAAGTTGTPWKAMIEFKKHKKFLNNTYGYGINWANEFVKTMMQQVYKKAHIVHGWNEKIIFVIQDVGLDYLKEYCDASGLHEISKEDIVHFLTFSMKWDENQNIWRLTPSGEVGTDIEGVRKILSGSSNEQYPTKEEFIQNINSKRTR